MWRASTIFWSKPFVICKNQFSILKFNFKKHWTWTWKISGYLTALGLISWYIGLGLRKYLNTLIESDWFYYIFELDLQSAHTNLLDMDWFYDILDLDLKSTWTILLDAEWFYYNHAETLFKKYENNDLNTIKYSKLDFHRSELLCWMKNQIMLIANVARYFSYPIIATQVQV